MPEGDLSSVVPAQLAFLAIYNPLIAPTGDSISDQIVFYTSRSSRLRRIEGSSAGCNIEESQNEWNERLRQIGLAQAMVDFARYDCFRTITILLTGRRNFSEGKPVDSVETDKARVVIHELEKNWWILAVCVAYNLIDQTIADDRAVY